MSETFETAVFVCRTGGCSNNGIEISMPVKIPFTKEDGSVWEIDPPTFCGVCSNLIADGSEEMISGPTE